MVSTLDATVHQIISDRRVLCSKVKTQEVELRRLREHALEAVRLGEIAAQKLITSEEQVVRMTGLLDVLGPNAETLLLQAQENGFCGLAAIKYLCAFLEG